jgi:hypothetical protein
MPLQLIRQEAYQERHDTSRTLRAIGIEDGTPLIAKQEKYAFVFERKYGFPEELVVISEYANCVLADAAFVDAILPHQRPILATYVMKVARARVRDGVLAIAITCAKD